MEEMEKIEEVEEKEKKHLGDYLGAIRFIIVSFLSGFLTWLFTVKFILFKEFIDQALNTSSTKVFLGGAIFFSSFILLATLSGFAIIIYNKKKQKKVK